MAPEPKRNDALSTVRPLGYERSLFDASSPALNGATVTLALIGGSRLLRDATASLLSSQDGLEVVGSFQSAADFLTTGPHSEAAVLLIDCDRCDAQQTEAAVAALSSADSAPSLVLLCRELREEVIRCAIRHQLGGVILKSYASRDIRAAIAYIATGRTLMPAGWQRALACRNVQLALSPRHHQILALIAQGLCNEEIAAELNVSPNTIKFHVRALYSRLGVRTRVEAANRYARMVNDGR